MPARLIVAFVVTATALSGCTWLGKPSLPEMPLLPPAHFSSAALQETQQFSERVTTRRHGREQVMLAAWAVNDSAVNLVGLTPTGQRLFTLSYDGRDFTEDYTVLVSEPIPGREVLSHLQLAHWPLSGVQQTLENTPWRLIERDDVRRLYWRDRLIAIIERRNKSIHISGPETDFTLDVRQLTDQIANPAR